ncbi:MAG: hypothetical protein P4L53_07305 [Candidatus Obscuribacterales bacterium]|nr:hypothetical protein [Candidatus Obscuribacterales bacterium]
MADKPTVTPEKKVEDPTKPAEGHGNHTTALQDIGNPRPPIETTKPKDSGEGTALEKPAAEELKKITDVKAFNDRVQDLIKDAKAGKPVTFDVDNRTQMTDADGKPVKTEQSKLLYDQLAKSYPERAFTFAKPDVNPGDPGYTEIQAPQVKNPEGVKLSIKGNQLTTDKEIKLADGSSLPEGSKFAVGTVFDGQTVKSIDPTGKVWATTPEGKQVQVADAGQSASMTKDSLAADKGALAPEGSRIPIRTDSGKGADGKPLVDPDGKPLLDSYAITKESFGQSYKPGTTDETWAVKGKSNDHFLLPENVTVDAMTKDYGGAQASGAKGDYYMNSGFDDARNATAKNYTGETDPRSAKELLRIRKEAGIDGPTQVEAGLNKAMAAEAKETAESVDKQRYNSPEQRAKFNKLADDLAAAETPEAKAQILDAAMKRGRETEKEIGENRGEYSRDGLHILDTDLRTSMVKLAEKAAEHNVRAPREEAAVNAEAPKPEKVADAVFKPKGFHSSETHQPHDGAAVPEAVAKAMHAEPGARTPAEKAEVEKFMKEKGLSEEQAREVEGKFREGVSRGLPVLIALGAALGAAGSAMAATKDKSDKVTYGDK